MNASRQSESARIRRLVALEARHLEAVLAIENRAYAVPWTRGNFVDALNAGYLGLRLLDANESLLGYLVVMQGADEMHVLNLTVAPEQQGRGHGHYMLDELVRLCRQTHTGELLLEVRKGNARARKFYACYGLSEIGVRKAYYPAPSLKHPQQREDAVVMSLKLRNTG